MVASLTEKGMTEKNKWGSER